ncbi:MAG: ribonuclease HI [Alphaproteobacteria bacterium]|nr:ribonuclease HI [Alphaproteobacteria bacterium]
MIVKIYTDGACSGNPGPGGWGAVIVSDQGEQELSGKESNTTNNRMELLAAISALKFLKNPEEVELFTDSTYVKNGITSWIKNWQRNGWKNSEKKPVKNKDLWLELLEQTARHRIIWKWVKGHAGDELNEKADNLARNQCQSI